MSSPLIRTRLGTKCNLLFLNVFHLEKQVAPGNLVREAGSTTDATSNANRAALTECLMLHGFPI